MKRKFLLYILVLLILASAATVCAGAVRDEIPSDTDGAVDLNGDGNCSVKDVTLILTHIVHGESLETDALDKADVNGDGEINVKDATELRKTILYAYVPVKEVVLNIYSASLHMGETVQINATVLPSSANDLTLTYTSSDPSIASVDTNGKVSAYALGSTDITVTAEGRVSAVCKVDIIERTVTSVKLNLSSVLLNKGKTAQLTAQVSPSNADNKTITYKSSNPAAAQVDANGKVTAKGWGTAIVTATAASGVSASCIVSVSDIIETNLTFREQYHEQREGDPKGIILHHAAGSGPVENIHAGHLQNAGWAGIGYHFYVRKDGSVYRGRPEDWMGAHASNHNDYIGICSEGNYENETMSEAQKTAVINLIKFLNIKYGTLGICGHRDVNATACPGKNFPFDEIVKKASGSAVSGLNLVVNISQEIFPSLPAPSFGPLFAEWDN